MKDINSTVPTEKILRYLGALLRPGGAWPRSVKKVAEDLGYASHGPLLKRLRSLHAQGLVHYHGGRDAWRQLRVIEKKPQ